jgi:hypothetical protein
MEKGPTESPRNHHGGRRKAQNHFEVAEARTILVKKIMNEEREAVGAKTAKLRGLRLAKEAEDRTTADPVSASSGRPV